MAQTPGEKAVEGATLMAGGIGGAALGWVIYENTDVRDCTYASDAVDPDTGKSPRQVCEEERNTEQDNKANGALLLVLGVGLTVWGLFEVGSAAVDAIGEEEPATQTRLAFTPCSGCRLPGMNVAWSYRF